MSIATEITRLVNAKASIKTSIEGKGVTVPAGTKLDGYPALIDTIPTGSTGSWTPNPDWIDISTVNSNEINLLTSDGSTGMSFAVTVAGSGTYSIDWGDGTLETLRASGTTYAHQYVIGSGQSVNSGQYTCFKIRIYGASGNITRFQVKKNPNYNNKHYSPVLWAVFGTTAITNYSFTFYEANNLECQDLESCTVPSLVSCTTCSSMFYRCSSLRNVVLPSTSFGAVTDCTNMFSYCYSLLKVVLPASWGNATNCNSMFSDCYSLKEIVLPTSWGNVTNLGTMFGMCHSLTSVVMPTSWGNVTNCSSMFNSCEQLSKITLPNNWAMVQDITYMFTGCYSLRYIVNVGAEGVGGSYLMNMTRALSDCEAISDILTIAGKLSAIGVRGSSGKVIKLPGLRLTNQSSPFSASSPHIDVSYTSIGKTGLELLFDDFPNGLSAKNIEITGSAGVTGANMSVALVGNTTSGSLDITTANTIGAIVGMEVYGAGITDVRAVTFQQTTGTVTRTAHGLINGMKISFSSITTTTGIVINTVYYVVNATADTFQVSATENGTPLTLTNDGSGNMRCYPKITAIVANTKITLDIPATATGSGVSFTASPLARSKALLKGVTIIG